MDLNENALRQACFELAEHLMWEKDTARIEHLPEQMEELSVMTQEFERIANQNAYLIEELSDAEQVLCGAIYYLKALAIPPLRGNCEWFYYSLRTLLELCYPEGGPGNESKDFLQAMVNGSAELLSWSNKNSDE